jgi:hypothetical protein
MRYHFAYSFKKPNIHEISIILLDLGINFASPIPFGEIIAWRVYKPYPREKLMRMMWERCLSKEVQKEVLEKYEEINKKIRQQLMRDMWLG